MFDIQNVTPRTFEFAVNGTRYEVPLLNDLPFDVIIGLRDARKDGDGLSIAEWYVSEIFEKHAPGCTEGLTYDQVSALLTAYDERCNSGE